MPGVCFDAPCNEKIIEPTCILDKMIGQMKKKGKPLQTEKQKTWQPKFKKTNKKQKNMFRLQVLIDFVRLFLFFFACFFSRWILIWNIFLMILCFDFVFFFPAFVEINFFCWNRRQNIRPKWTEFCMYPTNSSHIESYVSQTCILRRGEPAPP